MPNPAPAIGHLLAVFASAFTRPTFVQAVTVVYGAILAPGRRTVTAAFGRFSLVALLADALHGAGVPTRQSAWYAKPEATFLDALAVVRRHPWTCRHANSPTPIHTSDVADSPALIFDALVEAACYAA